MEKWIKPKKVKNEGSRCLSDQEVRSTWSTSVQEGIWDRLPFRKIWFLSKNKIEAFSPLLREQFPLGAESSTLRAILCAGYHLKRGRTGLLFKN